MKYFVYILLCADKSYYIGVTNDLDRRIHEHEIGLNENSYVFNRKPFKLVYTNGFEDINAAIAFEKKIKGWTRAKKEALINNSWDDLKKLAECRNESHAKNKI